MAAISLQGGEVRLVQPGTREGAAKLAEDSLAFLASVDKLCGFAAAFLEAAGEQAEYVDQQKLRAAGLKVRLSKLAQERRLLDQEQGAALAAKQAELARLEG